MTDAPKVGDRVKIVNNIYDMRTDSPFYGMTGRVVELQVRGKTGLTLVVEMDASYEEAGEIMGLSADAVRLNWGPDTLVTMEGKDAADKPHLSFQGSSLEVIG